MKTQKRFAFVPDNHVSRSKEQQWKRKYYVYTVMTSLNIHYDSSRADIVPLPCLKLQLLRGTFTCPVAERVKGTSN